MPRYYGAIYLSEKIKSFLPIEIKIFLYYQCNKSTEHKNVWVFNNTIWSTNIKGIKEFEEFYNKLKDIPSLTEKDYDIVILEEHYNNEYTELTSTGTKFIVPQGYLIKETN